MRAGNMSPNPVSKVVFTAAFTILAKGAADETHVIFTCTLPTGYYYKPNLIEWTAASTSQAVFDGSNGLQLGAGAILTENQVSAYQFMMVNRADAIAGSIKNQPDSVTNDFSTWFGPENPGDVQRYMIDAAQGVSILQMNWMDTSASTTSAVVGALRAEFFRYTVEQGVAYPANSPTLITG